MLSLDYFSKAIDEGAPSPTVSLRVLGNGRDPCDLPLESFRIREEGRPRALTHLVGKDLLVARDERAGQALADALGLLPATVRSLMEWQLLRLDPSWTQT